MINEDGDYDFTFIDSSKKTEFSFYPVLSVSGGTQRVIGNLVSVKLQCGQASTNIEVPKILDNLEFPEAPIDIVFPDNKYTLKGFKSSNNW